MTAHTWIDRSLPLAERVRLACFFDWSIRVAGDDATAALAELLADVAAADRLARAGLAVECDASTEDVREWHRALAAYRARMAQGVGDG